MQARSHSSYDLLLVRIPELHGPPKKTPELRMTVPTAARRQAESTRRGVFNFLTHEVLWRDRYDFLFKEGYRLRPRYHPDWRPSWTGTNIGLEFCEDLVLLYTPDVMDATRVSDGSVVAIKTVKRGGQELQIAQFSSSLDHPANHCVRVLNVLQEPLQTSVTLMVMQYLVPWNDPEFIMIGDVVDFVSQVLEGLHESDGSLAAMLVRASRREERVVVRGRR
ncbi:hypothetical protein NUW54_g2779 [Trametes sanguinea]|uniref:Uncharacterized protein n=1 Tax=Trametes sanguinea TaxID=158606 RepID=A0ACC1Q494_9APHY|nr:hypothetical protein NUW54_g2779 [Trametes sanguinea]